MIKVRFAPSPTGIPHVGNIRTALFDYFLAKANNGVFVLRLEDTDQTRKVEGAEDAIKESLLWLGAKWDEYVVQSSRLEEYKKYASQLVEKGLARIDEGAVRFTIPQEGEPISWTDAVGNKEISYLHENIEDFIILKADGFPTYHFANVVDDHLMGITHVIRGEEWISSTPKHILLYNAFGWEKPIFAHVPNVMGTDGKKLSKRRGAKSVLDFKREGILPEALLNYLMLLGWSPKNDREILSKTDFEKEFKLEKINTSPAIFDERKLLWMNGEYIRMLSKEELIEKINQYDNSFIATLRNMNLLDLIAVAQTRVKTLNEFRSGIEIMIMPTDFEKNEDDLRLRSDLFQSLESVTSWNKQTILDKLMSDFISKGMKFPQIYRAVIGEDKGLPLADTFELLGKEETLNRLK